MRRLIRTSAVSLSITLCAATTLLWFRSYRVQDVVELHRRGDTSSRDFDDIRGVFSGGGGIGYGAVRITHPGVPGFASGWHFVNASGPVPWPKRFNLLGFSYWNTTLTRTSTGPVQVYGFTVPHALFITLFAIAPLVALRRAQLRRRRRRRNAAGLCVACGYDLRASGPRCPECGQANPQVSEGA